MTLPIWIGFFVLILLLLGLDLGVLNRKPHVISAAEALAWTAFWVALALAFNALVYVMYENHWLGIGQHVGHDLSGSDAALEFFAGYLVEKSLSVDNIFVIALIFSYFRVPLKYQHRVLFWGILGALVMRGVMIGAGLAILHRFSWIIYVFGGLLIATAVRMLMSNHEEVEPERNPLVRLVKRWLRVTDEYHEEHFVVKEAGKRAVTPLLLALVLIESTDVVFAVDSIPAVFAVTRDPFIVFTSNVFAILGLRSLYFALAAVLPRFRHLKTSLVFLLAFVGVKMILSHHYPLSISFSLAMIAGILLVGVLASILSSSFDMPTRTSPVQHDLPKLTAVSEQIALRVFVLGSVSTLIVTGALVLTTEGWRAPVFLCGLAVLLALFLWSRGWIARLRTRELRAKARERRAREATDQEAQEQSDAD